MHFYISLSTYLPSLILKILVNVILVYGSLTAVLAERRSDRCPGGISKNPLWISFWAVSSLTGSCRKIKLSKF